MPATKLKKSDSHSVMNLKSKNSASESQSRHSSDSEESESGPRPIEMKNLPHPNLKTDSSIIIDGNEYVNCDTMTADSDVPNLVSKDNININVDIATESNTVVKESDETNVNETNEKNDVDMSNTLDNTVTVTIAEPTSDNQYHDNNNDYYSDDSFYLASFHDLQPFDLHQALKVPKNPNLARVQCMFHKKSTKLYDEARRWCLKGASCIRREMKELRNVMMMENLILKDSNDENQKYSKDTEIQNKLDNTTITPLLAFKRICFAFIVLKDPERRRVYEEFGWNQLKEHEKYSECNLFEDPDENESDEGDYNENANSLLNNAWSVYDRFFSGEDEKDRDYLLMNGTEGGNNDSDSESESESDSDKDLDNHSDNDEVSDDGEKPKASKDKKLKIKSNPNDIPIGHGFETRKKGVERMLKDDKSEKNLVPSVNENSKTKKPSLLTETVTENQTKSQTKPTSKLRSQPLKVVFSDSEDSAEAEEEDIDDDDIAKDLDIEHQAIELQRIIAERRGLIPSKNQALKNDISIGSSNGSDNSTVDKLKESLFAKLDKALGFSSSDTMSMMDRSNSLSAKESNTVTKANLDSDISAIGTQKLLLEAVRGDGPGPKSSESQSLSIPSKSSLDLIPLPPLPGQKKTENGTENDQGLEAFKARVRAEKQNIWKERMERLKSRRVLTDSDNSDTIDRDNNRESKSDSESEDSSSDKEDDDTKSDTEFLNLPRDELPLFDKIRKTLDSTAETATKKSDTEMIMNVDNTIDQNRNPETIVSNRSSITSLSMSIPMKILKISNTKTSMKRTTSNARTSPVKVVTADAAAVSSPKKMSTPSRAPKKSDVKAAKVNSNTATKSVVPKRSSMTKVVTRSMSLKNLKIAKNTKLQKTKAKATIKPKSPSVIKRSNVLLKPKRKSSATVSKPKKLTKVIKNTTKTKKESKSNKSSSNKAKAKVKTTIRPKKNLKKDVKKVKTKLNQKPIRSKVMKTAPKSKNLKNLKVKPTRKIVKTVSKKPVKKTELKTKLPAMKKTKKAKK